MKGNDAKLDSMALSTESKYHILAMNSDISTLNLTFPARYAQRRPWRTSASEDFAEMDAAKTEDGEEWVLFASSLKLDA